MFGEKDVIRNSGNINNDMSYDYRVLVLRPEALPKEQQKPENILWTPVIDGDYYGNHKYNSFNMITGVFANFSRGDFIGILRPEFENKIDFDALKNDYLKAHKENRRDTEILNRIDNVEDELEDEYY